jgi:hypothetical protein
MHQVQAKTAAVDLLGHGFASAIERLEDVFAILGIDAKAAVFNAEGDLTGQT